MTITSRLSQVAPDLFARAAQGEPTAGRHRLLAEEAEALREIELRQALPDPAIAANGSLRLAAWNLERCKHVEASAALLRRAGCDVALLSEMDLGMARSGNRQATRDLADALGAGTGYAFATEFIEVGLGNQTETVEHAGEVNAHGLHGNAVASRLALHAPALIPLEPDGGGSWWALDWHHKRIGGRVALAATIELQGQAIRLVSAHLESLPGPDRRAAQAQRILDHLALTTAADAPAVIAGDFNTATLPKEGGERPASAGAAWFQAPEDHEPLFRAFAEAGFEWVCANTPEPTRRTLANGRPEPPFNRLDWFFVRGLRASNPRVWPATDENGSPLSDHELITVDIRLP